MSKKIITKTQFEAIREEIAFGEFLIGCFVSDERVWEEIRKMKQSDIESFGYKFYN